MSRLIATCLVGLLALPTAAAGQVDMILVGGKVLTGDSSRPMAQAVALRGERIRAVGSAEEIRRLAGAKTRIVDLGGRTVIPGLIDAHVHLLLAPEIVDERSLRNYERTALPTVMSGFLSHGITTVRSTGDPLPYIVELRDRMELAVTGPRVLVTGPVASSPSGHPATTVCENNAFCRRTLAREVENEAQARQVVREVARAKVNAVKLVIDDVIGRVPALSDQVVAALVDEAHRAGLRVIVHMTVRNAALMTKRLVELGVDEFVHPTFDILRIPDAADVSQMAALLAGRKIPVTTTASGFDAYRDSAGVERASFGFPYSPAMHQRFEKGLTAFRLTADAGVKLVVGTDWYPKSVTFDDPRLLPGAQTIHEMELLRRGGLSTSEIVTAATRNAAETLGIGDKVGTIAEGKVADLVVLDGDLLQDFSALQRAVAVLKGGRLAHGALP
jgi:enamidase